MNLKIVSLIIIIFLGLIGVIGDFFIKLSGNSTKFIELRYFAIGLIIYALTAFGWFYVMKNIKLSTLGVFYGVSTVLFLTIVSVFYFKESLNLYEIIGIASAILSLILLGKFA